MGRLRTLLLSCTMPHCTFPLSPATVVPTDRRTGEAETVKCRSPATPRSLSRPRACRGPRPAWAQLKARAKLEPNPMPPRDGAPPSRGPAPVAAGRWPRATPRSLSRALAVCICQIADFGRKAVAALAGGASPSPFTWLWNERHLRAAFLPLGRQTCMQCLSQRLQLFLEVVVLRSVRTENMATRRYPIYYPLFHASAGALLSIPARQHTVLYVIISVVRDDAASRINKQWQTGSRAGVNAVLHALATPVRHKLFGGSWAHGNEEHRLLGMAHVSEYILRHGVVGPSGATATQRTAATSYARHVTVAAG
jgi:hypothetical protein